MSRKNFLRNCLMAVAISVLPKSLLPSMGEIEEEMVDIELATYVIGYDPYTNRYKFESDPPFYSTYKIKKETAEYIAAYSSRPTNK